MAGCALDAGMTNHMRSEANRPEPGFMNAPDVKGNLRLQPTHRFTVNHSAKEYAVGDIHSNTAESYLNWEACKNETYNVGNDELNMNKLQLAEKIQKHLPLEIMRAEFTSDPDTRDYIVSSQKFYDNGFVCKYNLDDGIQQLIKAYNIIESPWYANY